MDAPVPRQGLRARAVLIAVLVPLAGAALGLAGFRFEQVGAAWRPTVTRTAVGWRITGSAKDVFSNPVLSGSHAAWDAGPFTLLADLRLGRVKLIGAAHDARSTWQPAVSNRFVTWVEAPGAAAQGSFFYVYDLNRRRRFRVRDPAGVGSPPQLSGDLAYWVSGSSGGPLTLRGQDLRSGRRFSVGPWPEGADLVVAGGLAAWVETSAGGPHPVVIAVQDLASGRRWQIPLTAYYTNTMLDDIQLSGHIAMWRQFQKTNGTAQILGENIDTGQSIVVTSGENVDAMAFDGDLVVWAKGAADDSVSIMGLRLSGGSPFTVTQTQGPVDQICLSGDNVLWMNAGHGGAAPSIETAQVPS